MLTLHKKLLANLTKLLHGRFGQILIVKSTFQPLVNVGVLGEPRRPWPGWLLALRHTSGLRRTKNPKKPFLDRLRSEIDNARPMLPTAELLRFRCIVFPDPGSIQLD